MPVQFIDPPMRFSPWEDFETVWKGIAPMSPAEQADPVVRSAIGLANYEAEAKRQFEVDRNDPKKRGVARVCGARADGR